jgi:hypothetical protein
MTAPRAPSLVVVLALALGPHAAGGQAADSLFPFRVLDRPSTLPRGASRLDVSISASRQPGASAAWLAIVGGGVGVGNGVEVGGQLLPLSLAPGRATVGDPSVYASYAFDALGTTFVPTLQVVYPLSDADPFFVDVGVPTSRSVGRAGSIQLSPTLTVNTRADGAGTSITLPILFMRQESAAFSWQLSSGIGLSRFDPRSGLSRRSESEEFDDVTVPLVAEATYSLARPGRRKPWADLILQLSWPQLYTRGPARQGSHADDWTLQLQSSWYAIP